MTFRLYKYTIALFISAALPIAPLSAQILSATDSLQLPEAKPEPRPSELELPDVLILGQDRSYRSAQEKKTISPEAPEAVVLPRAYSPAVRPEAGPRATQDAETAAPHTWASLRGGTAMTFFADAGHRHLWPQGEVIAMAHAERSDGQYRNSRSSEADLRARGHYILDQRTRLNGRFRYERAGYGLQSAAFARDDARRRAAHGLFGVDLERDFDRLRGSAALELGGLSLRSDTAFVRAEHSSEFFARLRLRGDMPLAHGRIQAGGELMRDAIDDGRSQTLSWGSLDVSVQQPLRSLLVNAGVQLQSTAADSLSKSRLAPVLGASFSLDRSLVAALRLSSGFRPRTFSDDWRINPYLHSSILRPEEEKIGVRFDIDFQPQQAFRLTVGFHRRWMAELFCMQAMEDGLFALLPVKDAEVTERRIGVTAKLGRAELDVSFVDMSDDLGGRNFNRLPYRPDYRLPMHVVVGLPGGVNLRALGELTGSRRKTLDGDAELPPYFRLDLQFGKSFGRLEASAAVQNLFNSRYAVWEKYYEPGFIITAGCRYRFQP